MSSTAGKSATIVAALWSLFVTLPLWFAIVYQILSAINASGLLWGMYFAYAPASIAGVIAATAARLLTEE